MRMSFLCGYCQSKLAADASRAGSAVTCPRCRAVIEVPTPFVPEPEVAEVEVEAPAPPRRKAVRELPEREPEPPRRPKRKSSARDSRPIRRSNPKPSGNATKTALLLLLCLVIVTGGVVVGVLTMPGHDAKKAGVARNRSGERSEERKESGRQEWDAETSRPPDPPPVDPVPFLPPVVPLVPPAENPRTPAPEVPRPVVDPLPALVPKRGTPLGWETHTLGRMTLALPGGLRVDGRVPPGLTAGRMHKSQTGVSYNYGQRRYFPADKPFPRGGEAAAFQFLPGGAMIAQAPRLTFDGYPAREYVFPLPFGGETGHVWYTFVDGEAYAVGVYAKQLPDQEAVLKPIRDSIRFSAK